MTKLEAVIKQFESALGRLDEVISMEKTEIVRDSAIQRFEFTMDLSWKAVKAYLEEEKGIICASPKECFREAYKQGLIDYDEDWIKLVDERNKTAHMYDEKTAEEVYSVFPSAAKLFRKLLDRLASD
ncbi:MAG: HI0074 family nucleotidyltransferase substrate-binding subunit [Candidatus Margulisiibacteriota bacterium]